MRFEHVIFDLDGTLIDSKDDLADAANAALCGLSFERRDPRELYGYIGGGARALVQRALGEGRENQLEAAVAIFLSHYRRHLLDRTRPYPGVVEMLGELWLKGVAVTLLTNKPADLAEEILKGLGLRQRLAAVIAGDTLPVKKPDPAGALRLCGLVGVGAAGSIIAGDSAIDVHTARAAGAASCGVTWGFSGARVADASPDYLIGDPRELIEIVDQLRGA